MEPPPAARRLIHTRAVAFRGYQRDDGLWDIEGELTDSKAYPYEDYERGLRDPADPVHRMSVLLTIDDTMTIVAVRCDMAAVPFDYCGSASANIGGLVGQRLAAGWRQAVNAVLGDTKGCTHVRELLFGMGTAAIQTIIPYRQQFEPSGQRNPFALNTCHSWADDGPVVARHLPAFYKPEPS